MQPHKAIEIPNFLVESQLLGTKELSRLFNFTPVHIRRLVASGKLPKPKIIGGRKLAWKASDIKALLDSSASEAR